MLPDPAFYADCISWSFEELRDAALLESKPKNVAKKRVPRKKPTREAAA
jgi:hypothetical protein